MCRRLRKRPRGSSGGWSAIVRGQKLWVSTCRCPRAANAITAQSLVSSLKLMLARSDPGVCFSALRIRSRLSLLGGFSRDSEQQWGLAANRGQLSDRSGRILEGAAIRASESCREQTSMSFIRFTCFGTGAARLQRHPDAVLGSQGLQADRPDPASRPAPQSQGAEECVSRRVEAHCLLYDHARPAELGKIGKDGQTDASSSIVRRSSRGAAPGRRHRVSFHIKLRMHARAEVVRRPRPAYEGLTARDRREICASSTIGGRSVAEIARAANLPVQVVVGRLRAGRSVAE
jgi:hypothetical protein